VQRNFSDNFLVFTGVRRRAAPVALQRLSKIFTPNETAARIHVTI
jgi:hypothetical protein